MFSQSPPSKYDGQSKCQYVIQVYIKFVIPIGGLEQEDKKNIITDDSDYSPRDTDAEIILERASVDFFKKHPKRNEHPNRHNDPADESCRHKREKQEAKNISDEPQKEAPTDCVF